MDICTILLLSFLVAQLIIKISKQSIAQHTKHGVMPSEGTHQQQASNLKHGDDASSNLVAAVANTHTDTTKMTDSRIDKLLNILQGKTARESWDPTFMKKDRRLECWELSIQPTDWDLLIERGFTWTQLQRFMDDQHSTFIIMGPLTLIGWNLRAVICSNCQVRIGTICFYQFNSRHSDAEIKTTLDGCQRLLRTSKEVYDCTVFSNSAVATWMSKNGEYLKSIEFEYVINLDVETWKTCLHNPNLVKVQLNWCSFVDKGAGFCEWLANRKHPIDMLSLESSTISAALLASALRSTTCVEKLCIFNTYNEADWDLLINAISQMQILKSFFLSAVLKDHSKWMKRLSTLMTNAHLQCMYLQFTIGIGFPKLDRDTEKQNTERIHALLKMNPHVLSLQVPPFWIDGAMWNSQVKPIISERQAKHLARELEGLTAEAAGSLIKSVLCKDRFQCRKPHANAVLQFVLHNSDTFKALWDTGREKRMMALVSNIRMDVSRYIEMAGKSGLPGTRWELGKQLEISVSLHESPKGNQSVN